MKPPTPTRLDQVHEEVVDPAQRIIDPHHHLWPAGSLKGIPYQLHDLHADTGAGHNVEKTVFVQSHASYDHDAAEHLQPVGETVFVAANAAALRTSGRQRSLASWRTLT